MCKVARISDENPIFLYKFLYLPASWESEFIFTVSSSLSLWPLIHIAPLDLWSRTFLFFCLRVRSKPELKYESTL
jgi:hypothetical protein